jgi:hypothetical protein
MDTLSEFQSEEVPPDKNGPGPGASRGASASYLYRLERRIGISIGFVVRVE